MNENIDLTKILKNCPKGWKFYSNIYGDIIFDSIGPIQNYPIIFSLSLDNTYHISVTKQGQLYSKYVGECTVFPSKDQRDWSKFTATWLKEEMLPKTWEDFNKIMKLKYPSAGCFVEEIPQNLIDSYPTLNQIVAVLKLKKLRDYYNNNWHCDWRNEHEKNAVIIRSHGELKIFVEWSITTFLTFKSTEIAKEFLTNFRGLIEQAGDLI